MNLGFGLYRHGPYERTLLDLEMCYATIRTKLTSPSKGKSVNEIDQYFVRWSLESFFREQIE